VQFNARQQIEFSLIADVSRDLIGFRTVAAADWFALDPAY
jgi:hypothetical protein